MQVGREALGQARDGGILIAAGRDHHLIGGEDAGAAG